MGKVFKSKIIFCLLIIFIPVFITLLPSCKSSVDKEAISDSISAAPWYGWNKYQIKPEDTLVRLGHDLIENTSYYFGPKGKVAAITNGMNCQNCHLQGGILPWGNNFSAVIISYPKFSYRSGKMMSLSRRINDCFERSLNGKAIDTTSHEMQAIIAYMHWIGDDIPHGKKPLGAGIMKLKYLDRAADPAKGQIVFINNCQKCHGKNGEGKFNEDASGFIYPPLWGANSFNTGAGLYRISSLAGFVKNNMPFEESNYQHPKLSDEEAWDVAAFINSQPRPLIKGKIDYPDISKKEIDNPTGPYSDTFSELQHKYGPYQPIADALQHKKNTD